MEYTGGYRNERIEEWMEQQEVSSCDSFCACCDPQSIKRRRARYVLFKQLALEEIEKRCQKYEDKLLPEEKEAIEEVKKKFSRGNYYNIQVYDGVGTFYAPVSIILSRIYSFPLLFPVSYLTYWIIGVLRLKYKHNAFYINILAIFLLILAISCLWTDIFTVLLVFPFILLFLLIELALLAISIIFCYGFYFLSSHGVLHYRFIICLRFTISKKPREDRVIRTIRHAPFRRLYSRPIRNIFYDMNIRDYDFGEINGQLVTQDGINSYNRYYLGIRDET